MFPPQPGLPPGPARPRWEWIAGAGLGRRSTPWFDYVLDAGQRVPPAARGRSTRTGTATAGACGSATGDVRSLRGTHDAASRDNSSLPTAPACTSVPLRIMAQARTHKASGESSTIGAGARIRGRVTGDGDLVVAGHVEGDILVRGDVTIDDGASCTSNVEGHEVTVAGTLVGRRLGERPGHHRRHRARARQRAAASAIAIEDGAVVRRPGRLRVRAAGRARRGARGSGGDPAPLASRAADVSETGD